MISFKTFFSLYAISSLLYTGSILIVQPIISRVIDGSYELPKLTEYIGWSWPPVLVASHFDRANPTIDSSINQKFPDDIASADSERIPPSLISDAEPLSKFLLDEDLFLSRAFSQSMLPSKIIPFYYRASGSFSRDDITIATLVTGNRFEVLGRLVQRYQGPISVAIHVTDTPQRRSALLIALHELYRKTPGLAEFLDVHLILDVFERQFNTWRNIARFFAAHRTDFVMMLDVDFALCTDFQSRIRDSAGSEVMKSLRRGTAALVLPAFEYTKPKEGLNETNFPRRKEDLLSLVNSGRLGMFHAGWEPGHGSTNYKRYYASPPGEVYPVTDYQQAYEPYVIFKNTGTPWCDERFIGYGGNKAACLFEMWLSGVDFFVLSDDFIIHQSHPYAEHTRKQERKYNRKTYMDYREEACLRYIRYFLAAEKLHTSRGHNLLSECRKIKGFTKIAAELVSTHDRS